MKNYVWQRMRRDEIAAARDQGALVIVPIGSTEQHGPHLPVDVDIFLAESVALAAAQAVDDFPVLVAPPIWSGLSPHHMHFTGTITLSVDTFSHMVREVVRSLWHHGFRHILLLNGHGGNRQILEATCIALGTEGIEVGTVCYWDLAASEIAQIVEGERKYVGHADEIETSLMLHLRPESVAKEKAIKDLERPPKRLPARGNVYFWPVFDPGTTGVAGDPTLATAEKGKAILEVVTKNLVAFLRDFRTAAVKQ